GDLGDRRLLELAVAEQLDGGLQEAVERRAATRLLRRTHRGRHQFRISILILEYLSMPGSGSPTRQTEVLESVIRILDDHIFFPDPSHRTFVDSLRQLVILVC